MHRLGAEACAAAAVLATAPRPSKDAALKAAARAIPGSRREILAANARDIAAAEARGLARPLVERLMLDDARIEAMAAGLDEISLMDDPIGTVLAAGQRPNGLALPRGRVPLGVIGIIYESRPNVTADAGGLCLKSGNAAILRSVGKSLNSAKDIHAAFREGLAAAQLPGAAIQLIATTDRAAV